MVGSETVRQAQDDPDISPITAIVRKPTDFGQSVATVVHRDFLNYDALATVFAEHDACIWCLGISQSRVNAAKYVEITRDYVVAAAAAMLKANPEITFTFVSAMGADTSGKTPIRFGRVKGQAENALKKLAFRQLYIFRPGAIIANPKFVQAGFYKKIERLLMRGFALVFPRRAIDVVSLAKLMIRVIKENGKSQTYSQRDIFKWTRKIGTIF